MKNKHLNLKLPLLAILLCMVFVVNIGATFAAFCYSSITSSKYEKSGTSYETSLANNMLTVNNSTENISIPYSLGTQTRDISVDYQFSKPTDVCFEYSIYYSDASLSVDNVKLLYVDRDDYILDTTANLSNTSTYHYDSSASSGTLFYLNTLSGTGTLKLFSGVTFYSNGNNSNYEGKTFIIKITPHYSTNSSRAYDSTHPFKNYSKTTAGVYTINTSSGGFTETSQETAFSQWCDYKLNNAFTGSKFMIFNSLCSTDSRIKYAFDFNDVTEMQETTRANSTTKTTTYIYSSNENTGLFTSYTGGNKYYAGIGLYLMANKPTTFTVDIQAEWYKNNVSTGNAVNNINLAYSSSLLLDASTEDRYSTYAYTGAKYIDLIDYIQTTTLGGYIENYIDCYLVIRSIAISTYEYNLTTTSVEGKTWTVSQYVDTSAVNNYVVENTTNVSPILYDDYTAVAGTQKVNLAIINNANSNMMVNSVVIKPELWRYDGSTASINKKEINLSYHSSQDVSFVYDSNIWTVSTVDYNSEKAIQFTIKNNQYVESKGVIQLLSGIVLGSNLNDRYFDKTQNQEVTELDNADFWFDIQVLSVNMSATGALPTEYYGGELITTLTTSSLKSNESTYIACRNNTTQKITNIEFNYTMVATTGTSATISYTQYNYNTKVEDSGLNQNSAKTITFANVSIMPGETILLCKITNNSSSNVNIVLNTYSLKYTLENNQATSLKTLYISRQIASGRVYLVNNTDLNLDFRFSLPEGMTAENLSNYDYTGNLLLDKDNYIYYVGCIRAGQKILLLDNCYLDNFITTIENNVHFENGYDSSGTFMYDATNYVGFTIENKVASNWIEAMKKIYTPKTLEDLVG